MNILAFIVNLFAGLFTIGGGMVALIKILPKIEKKHSTTFKSFKYYQTHLFVSCVFGFIIGCLAFLVLGSILYLALSAVMGDVFWTLIWLLSSLIGLASAVGYALSTRRSAGP